jgi:hypothetical protein
MKKKTFGLVALALTLGFLGISASHAFAFRGDPNVTGPNYDPARHSAIQVAFENNDYDAWLALMKDVPGRVTEVITKDNFSQFAQVHRLMREGKFEEAKTLRKSLGLGQGFGPQDGHRGMYRVQGNK